MSNKRPVDKTKKSNIKCDHCEYWDKERFCRIRGYTHLHECKNANSSRIWTAYWNRCKHFRWREEGEAK